MLLSRQRHNSKKKYDPNYKTSRDANKLLRLSKANNKYLNIIDSNQKQIDRNKIYSMRSSNPIVLPRKIYDVPRVLSVRFGQLDDNEIIFESELMKYKPGIKHQYMSRWCQVTKTNFLYFNEGVPYASFMSRPLAVIPLSAIQSVKRVKVEVPEKNENLKNLTNFQFEIFLNPDDTKGFNYASRFERPSKEEEDQSYMSPLKSKEIQRSATKKDKMDAAQSYHQIVAESGSDRKRAYSSQFHDFHSKNGPQINIIETTPEKQGIASRKTENHFLDIPGSLGVH